MRLAFTRLWLLSQLVVLGCGDDSDADRSPRDSGPTEDSGPAPQPDSGPAPQPPADLAELLEAGIDEFLGAAQPTGSETISGVADIAEGSVVYDFDPEDGPVCLRGAPFHVSVLDQDSSNLVIFMQGGGACVSILCQASTEAQPRGVPLRGVLDVTDAENPVGDWNIVYVPYCDGSVFSGDNDFMNPSDAAGVRLHHGQRNFAAALDLALEHFPDAESVLLAGSSAGGWGTVYHRALVRSQYPDAELTIMNDAGIGFATNQQLVVDEWGSGERYRPASCAGCQTSAHMTELVRYVLEHDPGTVVGDFSSWEDMTIMRFTFSSDPAAFRMLLATETGATAAAFPERYKRFFIAGNSHTALQGAFHTTELNGITLAQWLGLMIERDPDWQDMLE